MVVVMVPAATTGVAVASQEADLDVLLLDQSPHTVLELPWQCEAALRPALDDGQAQVAELVLALHVVLAVEPRVLRVYNNMHASVTMQSLMELQGVRSPAVSLLPTFCHPASGCKSCMRSACQQTALQDPWTCC